MASDQRESSPPAIARSSPAGSVMMPQRWGEPLTRKKMGASRLYHPREFARACGYVEDGRILHPWSNATPTASETQAVAEMLAAGPTQSMIGADPGTIQLAAAIAERFTVESMAAYGRA